MIYTRNAGVDSGGACRILYNFDFLPNEQIGFRVARQDFLKVQ